MTILEYCIENLSAIERYQQKDFTWSTYDENPLNEIPQFRELLDHIPESINRERIIQDFRDGKFYRGFVMAMMWGGIGLRPQKGSKGNKQTTSAYKAFSTIPEIVDSRLRLVRDKIANEEFHSAYNLLAGEMKFDGIDVSFFTKLLSFISETFNPSKNLLIYDKWTKLLHVHLIMDENLNPLSYFSKTELNKLWKKDDKGIYNTHLINSSKKGNWSYEAYSNYNLLMLMLSNQIFENQGLRIEPFKLESYLFGESKKDNKSANNPRVWIQQNYSKQYAPLIASL
jgi:predicted nucleic acid-binding protein